MAKPTTAAALGLMTLVWTYFNIPNKRKYIFISIFISILLLYLSALYIDGSIPNSINRYYQTLYELNQSGSHNASNIFTISIQHFFLYILNFKYIIFFIFLILIGFILSKYINIKFSNISIFILLANLFILLIFINTYQYYRLFIHSMGHFLWAPALGAFLQTLSVKPSTKQLDVAKCPNTIWAIFLSFLPIAYGMGSNNSILITTAFTAYFLLLAFFTILRRYLNPREWFFKIAGLSILSLILSLGFLYVILANPYRQPYNLWENDFPFSPQKGTKEVYLNRFVGGYLSALRQLTEDNGFKQGGAFIDLTGRLPGTQLIVGGLTKGTSWILSGYRNSQA
ncbi:MAG: hypothetical protein LBI10_12690, partial [Deltaproteobacteria bacterium]|nr:hypothetical protein [Deltaproteobacteria bacterium]